MSVRARSLALEQPQARVGLEAAYRHRDGMGSLAEGIPTRTMAGRAADTVIPP